MQGASEDDVDIPSATNTALTWAFFMGTSANIRYQVPHPLLLSQHPGMEMCVMYRANPVSTAIRVRVCMRAKARCPSSTGSMMSSYKAVL